MQNQDVSQNDDSIDYRLPTNVKPISYEIILIPKLQYFAFEGFAKIEVVVERETNNITLHVGNIKIESVNILSYDGSKILTSYNNNTEKYTMTFPQILTKNKRLTISFSYNGILSDMTGIYGSFYFDENEQIR